jgi:ribosomal protein S8
MALRNDDADALAAILAHPANAPDVLAKCAIVILETSQGLMSPDAAKWAKAASLISNAISELRR